MMKKHLSMLLLGALTLGTVTMTSCSKGPDEPTVKEYTIEVTGGEARVDGNVVVKALKGTEVTLTADAPEIGYRFDGWTVLSDGVEVSGDPATFIMPAENVSFKAEFSTKGELDVYDYITDPEFKSYCVFSGFDTNDDGILSQEEATAVEEIDVSEMYKQTGVSIESLAGIEYFTSITWLNCYSNAISALDLSKNTELTYLHVGTNGLTELDLSKNTKIVQLYVNRNPLLELDLSALPDLEILYYHDCASLKELDLSKNPKLIKVEGAWASSLEKIDVSNNPALLSLSVNHGKLISLDVSSCTELQILNCAFNQLVSIDVSKSTKLTQIFCHDNEIASLDLSQNKALYWLDCFRNRIEALDVTDMTVNLDSYPYNYWMGIGTQTSDGTTPRTVMVTMREDQKPHWVAVSSLNEENAGVEIVGGTAVDIFATMTDPAFKTYCERFDTDGNGKLSMEEALAVMSILVPNMGIESLAGLEYFTGLKSLVCNDNRLTTLNINTLTEIENLVCNNNQLTSFDCGLYGGNNLRNLNLSNNRLTKFHEGGLVELLEFKCSNNLLTDISLHNVPKITIIDLQNNQLKSLSRVDLGGDLVTLNCPGNKLTSLDVSGLTNLTNLTCHTNEIASLDLSGCTSLSQVVAFSNRMTKLDASSMGLPTSYTLLCGQQTADGTATQTLTLTLREEQKAQWENLKKAVQNSGVVLAN